MSSSSIYEIYKTKAIEIAEFRNSHGSAPPVWGWLAVTFLGMASPHGCYFTLDNNSLWDLASNSKVPMFARLCHAMTFDYAYVRKENFSRMAEACAEMNATLEVWEPWKGCVNHWGEFSRLFQAVKVSSRCKGLGLGCTSVSDPWTDMFKEGKDRQFECVDAVLNKFK